MQPQNSQRLSNIDVFNPVCIFVLLYCGYFLFGSLSLTTLPSPSINALLLIIMGLLSFILGSSISQYISSRTKTPDDEYTSNVMVEKLFRMLLFTGICLSLGIVAYEFISFGIPVLNPEIRTGSKILHTMVIVFLISTVFFLTDKLNSKINYKVKWIYVIIFFMIGCGVTISTAYRSPTIIFILASLIVVNYSFIRLSPRHLSVGTIVLGLFVALVAMYRERSLHGDNAVKFMESINPHGYPEILTQIHLQCREGTVVFSDIVDTSPIFGLYNGQFIKTAFETLLPGTQIGPRTVVSLLRETRLESSTTPSILGGPYLDFGVLGLVLSMFLVGYILMSLYISLKKTQKGNFRFTINLWVYSISLAIFLLSIHSGLLDGMTIIYLTVLLFIATLINGKHRHPSMLATWFFVVLIFGVIFTTPYSIQNISAEKSYAIDYCSENIRPNEEVLVDKYLAQSAVCLANPQYHVSYNLFTNHHDVIVDKRSAQIECFVITRHSSTPPQFDKSTVKQTTMKKVYANRETFVFFA